MSSNRKVLIILAAEMLGVVLLDQLTKALVRSHIPPNGTIEVIPGLFNLVHWTNTGIAFGLFQGRGGVLAVLSVLALVGIPLLFWWEWRRDPALARTAWGLGLILGGALGNLLDRLRLGSVTDFLDFYAGDWHWHAFNVADSAICVGTGLVLYLAYRRPPAHEQAHSDAASSAPAKPCSPKSRETDSGSE